MEPKLTRLTQKIAIQVTAPSSRELYHLHLSLQQPVRKLLDTPS